jgi:multiple sugar transport system ATP-binding protein
MALVRLRRISKVFDGSKPSAAVDDVNLEIADGEFTVLVGPSGSGKSTLLRIIAGLERATNGDVWIGDRRVNDVPPKDRDIAMVFQSYALYPHRTVYRNLSFALELRGVPKAEIDRRVREAASMFGLESLLDRYPRQLSGGQRQRVAVGRAIVRQPQAFLFDEPLSNLDATLRVQLRRELAALHRRLGATMVYVTHDQVEAMTLGDRIVVLRDGRVQQVDTPMALYDRPRNRFVGQFIGSPAMNVLEVDVLSEGRVRAADGALEAEVPTVWRGALTPEVGNRVLLGIRPEHVKLVPDGETAHVRVRVDAVEPMGNETLLHGETASGDRITARLPGHELPKVGSERSLAIDLSHLHFFECGTGDRLEERSG